MNWNEPPESELRNPVAEKTERSFGEAVMAPWIRFFEAFESPTKLMKELAREPRWAVALLAVMLLSGAMMFLTLDATVEASLEGARASAEWDEANAEATETFIRMFAIPGVVFITAFISVLVALVYWFIFKVMGDQGRIKQWLAVVAHAGVINAAIDFVTALVTGSPDPLSLVMLVKLDDGFLASFLGEVSLGAIWTALVTAVGAAALSPQSRSFRSALVVVLVLTLGVLAIFAALGLS